MALLLKDLRHVVHVVDLTERWNLGGQQKGWLHSRTVLPKAPRLRGRSPVCR